MLSTLGVVFLSIGVIYFTSKKGNSYLEELRFIKEMSGFAGYCYEQIRFLETEKHILISNGAKKYAGLSFLREKIMDYEDFFGYRQQVLDFFEGLGSSDKEGQLSLCLKYKEFFEGEYNAKKEYCKNTNKMYKTLGIFSVAAVVILVI